MRLRAERHSLARAKPAEQGIIALPLYMLRDFTPGIDCESEEAGRIEYMLEDAGLLDALVVAPSQVAAADALLATEGLSDCRLDIEGINTLIKGVPLIATPDWENSTNDRETTAFYAPPFPASANHSSVGNGLDWEPIVATILTMLGQGNIHGTIAVDEARLHFNDDVTWTHGLL